MLSVHTSALEQPGTGDAGGLSVYVAEVAKQLAARGREGEIVTRATSAAVAPVVEMVPGVLTRHVLAGPYDGLSKQDLPGQLRAFAAGVMRAGPRLPGSRQNAAVRRPHPAAQGPRPAHPCGPAAARAAPGLGRPGDEVPRGRRRRAVPSCSESVALVALEAQASAVLVPTQEVGARAHVIESLLLDPDRRAVLVGGSVRHASGSGWGTTTDRLLLVHAQARRAGGFPGSIEPVALAGVPPAVTP